MGREQDGEIQKAIAEFEAKLKPVTPEMIAAAGLAKKKGRKKAQKAKLENLKKIEKLKGEKILEGVPASPGIVVGTVRNVHERDRELMAQIKAGEVLVSDRLTPFDIPYMEAASAFITDSGGVTSSTAIVAKEWDVPAVTGTVEGTQVLKDGQKVVVDGTEGTVYAYKEETPSRYE